MDPRRWTRERLQRAIDILGECDSLEEAIPRIGTERSAVFRAFRRYVGKPPSAFLRKTRPADFRLPDNDCAIHELCEAAGKTNDSGDAPVPCPPLAGDVTDATPASAVLPRDVQRLVSAIRVAPKDFGALCDSLDMAPRKCRAVIDRAEALGVQVGFAHDHVGLQRDASDDEIQAVGADPVVGQTKRVAVLSDTHYGSKYCLRGQIADFIRHAYEAGCREVLCPGDLLDGCYKHGIFELTHSGIEAQTDDAAENLPQFPGLSYYWITGNHDFTFTAKTGVGVGTYVVGRFAEHGRHDVRFYGDHGAYLRIGGAVVHLWHPRGSGATYAISYPLQKAVEKYTRVKPHILLAGHWHRAGKITQRGVHALQCPCFQGGQSAFGKSIPGNPVIGGYVLSWQATGTGTIRKFAVEECIYYEDERPVDVRNPVDGKAIPPTVSRPVAVPEKRWQSCSGGEP